jgi:hypothetical protein
MLQKSYIWGFHGGDYIRGRVPFSSCKNSNKQKAIDFWPYYAGSSVFEIGRTQLGFFFHGVRLSPLGAADTVWPIVPAPDDRWWWLWSNWWNVNWQGKLKYSERTCLSATLSTTNPTWPDPGWNPDRRGLKPATNRLSYGTATQLRYFHMLFRPSPLTKLISF